MARFMIIYSMFEINLSTTISFCQTTIKLKSKLLFQRHVFKASDQNIMLFAVFFLKFVFNHCLLAILYIQALVLKDTNVNKTVLSFNV